MAQYCYYNTNTQIRCVNFNGNTYRFINHNGTVFTISTWYSGTCINGNAWESTYSTKNVNVTDGYKHYVTERYQSRNGTNWNYYGNYTYTTWYFTDANDYGLANGRRISQDYSGYGQYQYMYVSFYRGDADYRSCYSMNPMDGTKFSLVTHNNKTSYYVSRSEKNDINFSYSTTSIANNTAFNVSNFQQYYVLTNHPKHGVTNYGNYTVSRNLTAIAHHFWDNIYTVTF